MDHEAQFQSNSLQQALTSIDALVDATTLLPQHGLALKVLTLDSWADGFVVLPSQDLDIALHAERGAGEATLQWLVRLEFVRVRERRGDRTYIELLSLSSLKFAQQAIGWYRTVATY